MRKLLPLLGLLLACTPSAKAQTYTGRKAFHGNAGAATTSAVTITSQAAGNTNIVAVNWCDDTNCGTQCNLDTFTLTDTAGNTYNASSPDGTLLVVQASFRSCLAVVHASNINVSASNTLTLTPTLGSGGTVFYASISVSEWSGIAASPTDQTGTVNSASAVASPLSVTAGGATVQANEVVYLAGGIDAGAALAVGASYTALNSAGGFLDEYQIVSSTSTYTATETYSSTHFQRGILVTFKAAVAAAASVVAGPSKIAGPTKTD